MTSRLRVVVAEDDTIVREGIKALLETFPDIEIAATCRSLDELLAAVDHVQPDVVLTDIRMPPDNHDEGVAAARRLRSSHPDLGVVVLSQFVDPDLALAVLADGSRGRGYMLKEHVADSDHLVEGLRSVASGGSFIDSDVLDALVEGRSRLPDQGIDALTPREREVLSLMAEGRSNASIGESLFIGERSVEKHISGIFAKLDLTKDAQTHRRVAAVIAYLSDERQVGVDD